MANKARLILRAGKIIRKALKKMPKVKLKVKRKPLTRKQSNAMTAQHKKVKAETKKITEEMLDASIKDPKKRKFLGTKDKLELEKRLNKMTDEGVKSGKVTRIESKMKPMLKPGDAVKKKVKLNVIKGGKKKK